MQLEIERKARVADVDGLRRHLTALCGAPRTTTKRDRYFIEGGASREPGRLGAAKMVRIRIEGARAIATCKVRTLQGADEVNREIEYGVSDAAAFEEFLCGYLGFARLVDKVKRTESFAAPPLTHELSEVEGLGWFYEVECLQDATADAPTDTAAARAHLDRAFAAAAPFLGAVEPRLYIELLIEHATSH